MLRFSIVLSLAAGLAYTSGCGALKMPAELRFAFPNQSRADEQLDRLSSARSIAEIDLVLDEILDGKNGQKTVEKLLSGWGKQDSWYDLAVVEYIWERWPSYYGKSDEIDPGQLMAAIYTRIREEPKLLAQLFWYLQWRNDGHNFKWLCRVCESQGGCCSVRGEEFPFILCIASATRSRHVVDYDPPSSTTRSWGNACLHFLTIRPFLRFDAEQVAYVTDYDAQREGRYLTPAEQETSPPATPLPDWDSDVLPSPPVKKH